MLSRTLPMRLRAFLLPFLFLSLTARADLPDVLARGELRHLGIPYASFVTGAGDGLDVELVQRFATSLGVRYRYVPTNWKDVIGDLTGQRYQLREGEPVAVEAVEVRGDLIANGLTILPWRERVVRFSAPTFPSGVWLVARADAPLAPIVSSGRLEQDIRAVKSLLAGSSLLVMRDTCLDPALYDLEDQGLDLRFYTRSTNLNEMVPAILHRDAESTLLDVPDALIALEKWPGLIKVIGPVSGEQQMGVAFRPDAPRLREAFDAFLLRLKEDGTYAALVQKYYPTVFRYFPEFFRQPTEAKTPAGAGAPG